MTHTRFHKVKLAPGRKKFNIVMKEYSKGKLHDSHGNVVESEKQAAAIAFSEARLHQSTGEKLKHEFDACDTCIAQHNAGMLDDEDKPSHKEREDIIFESKKSKALKHGSRLYTEKGFEG